MARLYNFDESYVPMIFLKFSLNNRLKRLVLQTFRNAISIAEHMRLSKALIN